MKISRLTVSAAALASAAVLGGSVSAQTAMMNKTDGEWIMVTGPVSNVTSEGFRISHDGRALPVEMDGYLSTSTARLQAGDWVTVSGRIDDSLWERRSIEASSVYSSRLQERFWANPADEEGDYAGLALIDLPDDGEWVGVTGTVMSVDRAQQEMTLDTGARNMQVDLTGLGRSLMADRGDRVSVYGQFDDGDFWDAREIDATSVIILRQGSM